MEVNDSLTRQRDVAVGRMYCSPRHDPLAFNSGAKFVRAPIMHARRSIPTVVSLPNHALKGIVIFRTSEQLESAEQQPEFLCLAIYQHEAAHQAYAVP